VSAGAERTLEFVLSTDGIKRDGFAIDQRGWHLSTFRQNPQVLWVHDPRQLPIGHSEEEWLQSNNTLGLHLRGRCRFLAAEKNPFAEQVWHCYKDGDLRAVSVRWDPRKWEPIPREVFEELGLPVPALGGVRFTRQDLVEYSGVPLPGDPQALAVRMQGWPEPFRDQMVIGRAPEKVGSRALLVLDGKTIEVDVPTFVDFGACRLPEPDGEPVPLDAPAESDPPGPTPDETPPEESLRIDDILTLDELAIERAAKGLQVQSVLCSKLRFKTAKTAKKWVTDHQFTAGTMDETAGYYHFPQFPPGACVKDSIRTKSITDGVLIHTCQKAKRADDDPPLPVPTEPIPSEPTPPVPSLPDRNAIPYGCHGKCPVAEASTAWDGSGARQRLAKWASKDGSGSKDQMDWVKYRQGFVYSEDETGEDSAESDED